MSKKAVDTLPVDSITEANKSLRELCHAFASIGCTSATLFVRDPLLPYYLRMVADYGVIIRELTHGPLSVRSVVGSIMFEPTTPILEEWFGLEKLRELTASTRNTRISDGEDDPLYCSFVDRESVGASVLLRFIVGEQIHACVWVNFKKWFEGLPKVTSGSLRKFKRSFPKLLDALAQQLLAQVPSRIMRFELLHNAAKHFPDSTSGTTLEIYLREVLRTAIKVLQIEQSGFGTVYLLDESRVLRKVVQLGSISDSAKNSFSVPAREGLVSVSVERSTPVLAEYPHDNFPNNYVSPDAQGTSSTVRQAVIPLIVESNVIGVINIESKQTNPRFDGGDIFDLCAAGFRVASSVRVVQQIDRAHQSRTIRMLELASQAACESEPDGLRENLQRWIQEAIGADFCSIWQWSSITRRFVPEIPSRVTARPGFFKSHTGNRIHDLGTGRW